MDTELTREIKALLAYANEATGANDTRLGDAVKRLADAYKQSNNNQKK